MAVMARLVFKDRTHCIAQLLVDAPDLHTTRAEDPRVTATRTGFLYCGRHQVCPPRPSALRRGRRTVANQAWPSRQAGLTRRPRGRETITLPLNF